MTPNIDEQVRTIHDPQAPTSAKIAAAAVLWNLIEQANAAMEFFKAGLRPIAVATGKPVVTLNGDGMSQCKVVLPGPTLRLNSDLTVEGERAALGDLFNTLYEVRLVLRDATAEFIGTFPPHVRQHFTTVATLVPSTPRVSLRALPGVEEIR